MHTYKRPAGTVLLAFIALLLCGLMGCNGSSSTTPPVDNNGDIIRETWFMPGHDARRSRRSSLPGPDSVKLDWVFQLDSYLSSPLTFTGERFYAGTGYGLTAFTAAGQKLWSYYTNQPVVMKPVLGSKGRVYACTSHATDQQGYDILFALNADGSAAWQQIIEASITSGPVINSDGTVLVSVDDNTVRAYDPDTGSGKWSYSTNDRPDRLIATRDGAVLFTNAEDVLTALGPNGTALWTEAIDGIYQGNFDLGPGHLVYAGNTIAQAEEGWHVFCIDSRDGSRVWTSGLIEYLKHGPVAIPGGGCYVLGQFGTLNALNAEGGIEWTVRHYGNLIRPPAVGSDGSVYVGEVSLAPGADTGIVAHDVNGNLLYEHTNPSSFSIGQAPEVAPDGTLYIANNRSIYILNPDGTEQYEHVLDGNAGSAPVIGSDGAAYFIASRNLIAVNAAGREAWRFTAPSTMVSSPVVVPNTPSGELIICVSNKAMYGFSNRGEKLWELSIPGWSGASPVMADDRVIFYAARNETLYAVHINGRLNWSKPLPGVMGGTPSVAPDGTLYIASNNFLYSVNQDSSINWWVEFDSALGSTVSIDQDGIIYVSSASGKIYAVHPTGMIQWTYLFIDRVPRIPAIDQDGRLYVSTYAMPGLQADDSGRFYAINPDGSLVWEFAENGDITSSPAIDANGSVFLRIGNGLYSVSRDGTLNWSTSSTAPLGNPVLAADGRILTASRAWVSAFSGPVH